MRIMSPARVRTARSAASCPTSPAGTKALRDERVLAKDPKVVSVPDPDDTDVDVVIAETPHEPDRRRR